jgi:cytochrome c5
VIKQKCFVFGFAILLAASLFLIGCTTHTSKTVTTIASTKAPSATEGKNLVETKCTVCHNTKRIYLEKANADKWGKIVDEMITKGAVVNIEERTKIIGYLATLNQ